jgi:hypothetical protein
LRWAHHVVGRRAHAILIADAAVTLRAAGLVFAAAATIPGLKVDDATTSCEPKDEKRDRRESEVLHPASVSRARRAGTELTHVAQSDAQSSSAGGNEAERNSATASCVRPASSNAPTPTTSSRAKNGKAQGGIGGSFSDAGKVELTTSVWIE